MLALSTNHKSEHHSSIRIFFTSQHFPESVGGANAPDHGAVVLARPSLWPLGKIPVPRLRFEIAQRFILHLVEFDEEFDHEAVRIGMIDRNVVARAVAQRPPRDRDFLLTEDVAGCM